MQLSRLCIIALLMLTTSAFAQKTDDHLGLSRDQILAMGSDKWFDFYAKQKGDSTVAMTTACQVYAEALHERNIQRLEKSADKERLKHWYEAVKDYGDAMFKIQSRNGGTIWTPVYAAQTVDMEEMLDQLENLEAKPNKTLPPDLPACGERVLAHHDVIDKRLDTIPTDPLAGIGRTRVAQYNLHGRHVLQALIPELVKFGGQEAYLVFVTCSKLSDPAALFLTD